MPLNGAIIQKGATGLTVTAGAAETFTLTGDTVKNGVRVADAAITDYRVRDNITLTSRSPVLQVDGSYSKCKRTAMLICPRILASGKTVFNLLEIRYEVHPEFTAADELDLRLRASQLLFDTDLSNFWVVGSLA